MQDDILKFYFTDAQFAAVIGITVGGLRNKIYRKNTDDLPRFTSPTPRTRLWSKKTVRAFLMTKYDNDEAAVDALMARGEVAPPYAGGDEQEEAA